MSCWDGHIDIKQESIFVNIYIWIRKWLTSCHKVYGSCCNQFSSCHKFYEHLMNRERERERRNFMATAEAQVWVNPLNVHKIYYFIYDLSVTDCE